MDDKQQQQEQQRQLQHDTLLEAETFSQTLDSVLHNIDDINIAVVNTFDAIRIAANAQEKTLMDELEKIECDPNIKVYIRLVAEVTKKVAKLESTMVEAEIVSKNKKSTLTDMARMTVAVRYAREDVTELLDRCNNFFNKVIIEYSEQDLDDVIQKIKNIGTLSTQPE